MDILYALVPLSLLFLGLAIVIFFWAVRSGQFDDMDSPAHRILFDEDDDINPPHLNKNPTNSNTEKRND